MAKSTDDTKQVPQYANVIKDKQKILKQYLKEKDAAVKVRQVKLNNWLKNEEAYNGVIQKTLLTRSNLHIPIVFEGVQNMSAKLGAQPDFKYDTSPEGDENSAEIMKHVVAEDLKDSDWEGIYDDSKIECGIYGKTTYKVIPGNDKNRVELVDSMAYLISPIAKNTKDALYQGQQFIYKTLEQLEEEKDEMEYDEEELQKLRENKIPNETQVDSTSEASAKNLRFANMGLANTTQYGSKVAELTEWVTYLKKGKKSVLHHLTVANDMYLLRCIPSEELGLKRPNYVQWGTFKRGITGVLWTSIADVYRDPNLAIDVSINQSIDNSTYRNFGMMFVASSSGLKQSSIVPRPLGVTTVQTAPGEKVQDKAWQFTPPEIVDGLNMAQAIKGFADSAAGMAPSMPQQKGKVSVTQQAKLNADLESKIVVMKRNATNACEELYQLMAEITQERLTKPRNVKVFGYKSLTIEDVTKKNFKDVKFIAKATPSEDSQQNKAIKQKAKIDLYTLFKDDQKIPGQVAMRRSVAKTFDIDPDELQSWFENEEQSQPQVSQTIPSQESPQTTNEKPMTPETPLLSSTGSAAQAQVPKML